MRIKNSLSPFEYCPRCGTHSFVPLDDKAMGCSHCNLRYYANVASAVALIVMDEKDNLLSVVRARDPQKGTLDLAGGFVDPLETIEEAAERELMEETNLKATEIKYLFSHPNIYPYSGIDVYTCDLFFLCKVEDLTKAIASDDAADIVITKISEIKAEKYGLQSIRSVMTKIEKGEIRLK